MKYIALIPARSGSKGISKKNLAKLKNTPLLQHTVEAAKKSEELDDIFLSSDCDEILSFADRFNLKKIKRPYEFSNDNSSANDVIGHMISLNLFNNQDIALVYLQPTSPLRTFKHIDDAINLFRSTESNGLISVKASTEIPFKAFKIDDKRLQAVFGEEKTTRNRQDLEKTYYPNGAIYIFKLTTFLDNGSKIPVNNCIPFIMKEEESVDIDSNFDLLIAENMLNLKKI